MSEKSNDYEVEFFVKDNKIIMRKTKPIHLCVRPIYVYKYDCAYAVWGCCTAPEKQYESCKCYMNEDKNFIRCKYE